MDVQQLEEAWAARAGAREACLVAAPHVPAALSLLGIVRPGDRLVAFADDFADAFASGFDGCDVVMVGEPSVVAFAAASGGFAGSFDAGGPHLWWFVNSIGGFGLRVPDLRALGRAAREAHALLVVDNTVASAFGCDSLRLGAALSLEALDRVCAGDALRKLVAVSVARSQLKRHRVDAAAECAHALLEGRGLAKFELTADEAGVLERGLDSLDVRMQAHFDRARALSEYLAANEMVRNVRYPGLSSHPDHAVATGILEHGFGPAVEFDLIERSAGDFFDALPGEFRTSPAGGATTRLSATRGKQGSTIRLFAGTDDPLIVAATLDNALRN
ncbi:PLP-dependent transferase [Collinsella aerofaciens]|uniref:PLP-dependent transferase n=1 Tax=Collinsella aerofaciens TaxID=74426 RepID=UPI00232D9333|nr:PLP-dependent transferase [Collinsella aerofaciens]MDB1908482.1 PLP-dependent transferase [Collinsella aerofaciens]MDB1910589.1 PLP-dependent transferase [Collinsella aerofaciens]MDB1912641.1 PLP-dependent transferase [Collinsella aerofaciens]